MIFDAIAELIADRVECDKSEITMDSTFKDLGIDALDTVELLMDQEVKTVGELVAFIESK